MMLHICSRRLRLHSGQELLAGGGIAVGVALVFGVLFANTSLTGSAGELIHQVVGSARLELAARSPAGVDEGLAVAARGLPGVRASAAVLRENVTVVGRRGRRSVQLLGVSAGVVSLGSLGTRDFGQFGFRATSGLVLPASVANATGAEPGDVVSVLAFGVEHPVRVGAVLGGSSFGALASSSVAIALLPVAQRLAGLPKRVTLVLVEPRSGAGRLVAGELQTLAGGRLDVVPADNELRLLDEAVKPNDQATGLFAALSGMVGFLLALCAMLLTVPERRRFIADLRMQGYDWRQALVIMSCEAAMLGIMASLAGVVFGYGLSRLLFHRVPAYLASVFPIGSQQAVPPSIVLLAIGCGMLATLLASLPLVFDLNPNRARDAIYRASGAGGESVSTFSALALGSIGLFLIVLTTVLVLILRTLALAGGVALALATLCLIPAVFAGAARGLARGCEQIRGSAMIVASRELSAVSARSMALAGIAALAVYGNVAVGGAQRDVLSGLDEAIVQEWGAGQIWVTPDANIFDADSFRINGTTLSALAHAPGIASVLTHQGGFLDVGRHRLWIRATPSNGRAMILSSQLLRGELTHATKLLRGSGWATISSGLATEHDLHVGDSFVLPTPSGPATFGVAAVTTNMGWPSGTITINTNDYSHLWQTTSPTTLAISLKPDIGSAAGKRTVEKILGYNPALRVQSSQERIAEVENTVSQGLRSLTEIATLLVIAAALAVAVALSAVIWQRRPRLASMKIQGYNRWQLWRALLLECAIVLGIGCTVGAILGIYGHALACRALIQITGFPAPFSLDTPQVAITLALLASIAMAVIALPGLLAARVPARMSLQE
ncbi:MAG: FtsX-like permease family protein [Solirubrobacteraceae bacterium]